MKTIKIDETGAVEAIDWSFEDAEDDGVLYDAVSLGEDHAIYVDDEGLFRDRVVVCQVGDIPNLPLPAMIVGVAGERDVDATLTVDQVKAMIREVKRVR